MPRKRNATKPSQLPESIARIRRLALTLGQGELTEEFLVHAVLSDPEARSIAARITPYSDAELADPSPLPAVIEPDDPHIPWPQDIEYRDAILCEEGETPERDPDVFESLETFIEKLHGQSPARTWYRAAIAEDFNSLRQKIAAARTVCERLLPAQREPIRRLCQLLLDRAGQRFTDPGTRIPAPIVLLGYPGHGATTLLETLAKELGCRFVTVGEQLTSCMEFIEALEDKPPSIVEVTGLLAGTHGFALQSLLSTFANGHAPQEQFPTGEMFSVAKDSKDLEDSLARCLVIFYVELPPGLLEFSDYNPSELMALMRNQHWEKCERYPATPDIPDAAWQLVTDHNSVVLRTTTCRHLVHRLYREIRQTLTFFKTDFPDLELVVQSKLQLCALLILEYGYPTPKELKGASRRLLLDIIETAREQAISQNPSYLLRVDATSADLPQVLLHAPRPTKAWFNALEAQARQQLFSGHRCTYEVSVDHRKGIITLGRLRLRSPRAVSGGRFMMRRPSLRFRDVVGLEEAKQRLQTLVRYFRNPDTFRPLQAVPPMRILLAGPPGTGKTLLAKAFAGEASLPFFSISAAEITSQKFAGQGGSLLRDLFAAARIYTPSIIFIDELDAIGDRNSLGTGDLAFDARSILNTLLVQLDGMETSSGVVVIGATNRPDDLDAALLRPKRFGTRIDFEPLKSEARESLIRMHLQPDVCGADYEEIIKYVCMRTAGPFSPAEIEDIVNESKLAAESVGLHQLTREIVARTIDTVVLGKKYREMSPEYRRSVAYHESGHALLLRALLPHKQIERLTIGLRRDTAGLMLLLADEGLARNLTRNEVLFMIVILLGGAIAEELCKGYWDAGVEDDLERATQLALFAVSDLGVGMGIRGAVMAHLQHKNDPWPEELQVQVGGLMERCFSETRRLLLQFRSALERLASELEEREDLNHEDVCALIGDVQTDTHRIIETITNTAHLQADREPLPVASPPSKEAHALVAAS